MKTHENVRKSMWFALCMLLVSALQLLIMESQRTRQHLAANFFLKSHYCITGPPGRD